MEPYTITAELNLKKLIAEAREIAESLDEFADKLEKLEKKYADKREDPDEYLAHSNNGFPYFMEELTEDDLEKREDKKWVILIVTFQWN